MIVFFTRSDTSDTTGRGFIFYHQGWSVMAVSWARFLECPRQRYRFPSRTAGRLQTLLMFSRSAKLQLPRGSEVRVLWGLEVCAGHSDRRQTRFHLPRRTCNSCFSLLNKHHCQWLRAPGPSSDDNSVYYGVIYTLSALLGTGKLFQNHTVCVCVHSVLNCTETCWMQQLTDITIFLFFKPHCWFVV